MEEVLFFIAALGALGGAVGVIASRNPFYGVLALVIHLFSLAVLFLLLTAAFLAAAQVVVYAGAVMVLYVFVVAYVGGGEEPAWEPIPGQRLLAPLIGIALFVELAVAVLASSLLALGGDGPDVAPGFGDPAAIGTILLEKFLIPFEAASILLLLAAVGAVVLAGRRRGSDGEDDGSSSLATRRLDGGGLSPEAPSSSRAKRSEDPSSPPSASTAPSPPTSAGSNTPGATRLGVADDKGPSLSAISESGGAATPATAPPSKSASNAPLSPAGPSPAVEGGVGGPSERFAREERKAPGVSPTPPQRRVASEEGPPTPPSPAGGTA